jgi:predicted DNA-binding protein (MmcQ/YjbR family)
MGKGSVLFRGRKNVLCLLPEEPFNVAFKVPDEDFEELSIRDGFMPAPYMARAKWVLVSKPSGVKKKEWENFIHQSYTLIKNKLTAKLRKQLRLE